MREILTCEPLLGLSILHLPQISESGELALSGLVWTSQTVCALLSLLVCTSLPQAPGSRVGTKQLLSVSLLEMVCKVWECLDIGV